jgi:hypothetical protein
MGVKKRFVILSGVRSVILIIIFSLVVLASGCGGDDPADPRREYTLTYSLNITGESSVDQVTYTVGGRDVTLNDPTDGWALQIAAGDGQSVGASAEGTVKNGEIILYLSAVTSGRSPITGQDECSESAGISTVCSLDIPKVTLPK